MDATDLRVFEAVARTGSMNRAARELHTVQSNVTARVRALERELGFTLFQRNHKGASLTPAGMRLLPFAARASRLLEDARRAVADEGTPGGELVVGALETTVAMRLAPTLAQFAADYPAVDLSLRTGTSCELVDKVLSQQLDGAFVCGPVDHPELATELFCREELVLLTARSIADCKSAFANTQAKIVVLRAGCSYRQRLETLLARRGIVGVRVLEFATLEAIIGCVSAGLGVTLLPKALLETSSRRSPVRIHSLPNGEGQVDTVFIRHRAAFVSSALRAFLDRARPALAPAAAAE